LSFKKPFDKGKYKKIRLRFRLRLKMEVNPNLISSVRRKFSDSTCKNLRLVRDFARNPANGGTSGQPIRKRGRVSICLLLFSASPFGKGGSRGISNPQIPPYPPFLKGGRRGYEKMSDA
jgi:hypothetical protein